MVHNEPTNEQLNRLAMFFREKILETEIQRKETWLLGSIHEILDRTRLLATDELVISEGFRREQMRWLENLVAPEKKEVQH